MGTIMKSNPDCPICRGQYYIPGKSGKVMTCPRCEAEERVQDSGLPRRYWRATVETFSPSTESQKTALEAVNNTTKWAVSAAAFTTLLARRDLLAAWCVLGSVVAAINCRVS
jgi:uncharacterized Zn finger protein (UPF0148 family)